MNYQHLYHAGNAADVFKHLVLLTILKQLAQKSKPFCVIDTHAGAGSYDLTLTKTLEWQQGVGNLRDIALRHPLLQQYQQWIQDLTHFPGSPAIAQQVLREQDNLILIEQAELCCRQLHQYFRRDSRVHIHQRDAWQTAKALLPPAIRRGVVLIDPPYEEDEEWQHTLEWLNIALRRWATGTYLLWYPIKSRPRIEIFHRQLKQQLLAMPYCIVECCPWSEDVPLRLNGSGMVVINPPWQFEEQITPLMDELMPLLKQQPQGKWRLLQYSLP